MAETMSNLERYLRDSQGINFFARRSMLTAYTSGTGAAMLRSFVEKANTNGQLTEEAYADLTVLGAHEDADIAPRR